VIRTECRASASERQWTARREEGSRWSRFRRSRHVARMFRTMSREWSRASRWPKRQGAGALHRHALRPLGPPPLEPRAVVHDVPPPNRFEASLRNTARQRSSPIRYAPRSGGCARADVLSSRPALSLPALRSAFALHRVGERPSRRRAVSRREFDQFIANAALRHEGRTKAWDSFAFSECVRRHETSRARRGVARAAHRLDARTPGRGTAREHE